MTNFRHIAASFDLSLSAFNFNLNNCSITSILLIACWVTGKIIGLWLHYSLRFFICQHTRMVVFRRILPLTVIKQLKTVTHKI